MAGVKNFKSNLSRRREEAEVRKDEREIRGDQGQLQRLEARGFGECREAKRLRERLEKAS